MKKQEIKIEKGIPIPIKQTGSKLPFEKMKVGDSFSLPYKTKNSSAAIHSSARKYCIRHNLKWKFTARAFKEEKKVRIWRIK